MLPLETRGKIAVVCMWLIIFSCTASIFTNLFLQDYIVEIYSLAEYEEMDLTGEDIILFMVSLTWPVAFLFSSISFLVWFYRARINLERAGLTGFKHTPKWAVWGFIIPILSLFRPFQVMKEVWGGSKYLSGTTTAESWQKVTESSLVNIWWGMVIFMIVMDRVVGMFWEQSTSEIAIKSSIYVTIVADIVIIVAAYIAIKLILEVTDLQEKARTRTPEVSIPASIGIYNN